MGVEGTHDHGPSPTNVPALGGIKGPTGGPSHTAPRPYRTGGITDAGAGAQDPHLEGDGASRGPKVGLSWGQQPVGDRPDRPR
jgi:hypothetical protein